MARYEWSKNVNDNWVYPEADGVRVCFSNKAGWHGLKAPDGFLEGVFESAEAAMEAFDRTEDDELQRDFPWEEARNGTLMKRDDFTTWYLKRLKVVETGETRYKVIHDGRTHTEQFDDVDAAKLYVADQIKEWRAGHEEFRSFKQKEAQG